MSGNNSIEVCTSRSFSDNDNNSNTHSQTTIVDLGKSLLKFVKDKNLKGVQLMLARGSPFSSDWLGMTAIHFAVLNNNYEICETLIKAGINKDCRTKVDRTPLHFAVFYGHERIANLLLSNKCNVNPKDMLRMTPLHWAVEKRRKSIVRMLLKYNADVSVVSKFGKTPIALAVLTEQADILQELEAMRQKQQSKKINEQREKETSEAVNSIIGVENFDCIGEQETMLKVEMDIDDETLTRNFNESTIEHLNSIKATETGVLDKSAINLLKSHGISIMQDEDSSNNLLTTALQNGRQLILSEGGKMLLNEARRVANSSKFIEKISKVPTISQQQKAFSTNNNNNNIVPINVKSSTNHPNAGIKFRSTNIVSKAKYDQKNKEIRIISMNDFKKLYESGNIKTMQKLPELNKSNIVKQVFKRDENNLNQKKIYPNAPSPSNNQITSQEDTFISSKIKEEVNDCYDEINLPPNIVHVGTGSDSCDSDSHNSAMHTEHLTANNNSRQMNKYMTIDKSSSVMSTIGTNYNKLKTGKPAVIPLITAPEMCREMIELRRQNEELRKKFELVQKENEEIRQRLERLEGVLLVEQMDETFSDL